MKKSILVLLFVIFSLNTSAAEDALLVGTLKSKNHLIDMFASETGQRFTLSSGGKIVAENLTASELEERYPNIFRMINEGVSKDASLSPFILKDINNSETSIY